jgi:hypothetical protein
MAVRNLSGLRGDCPGCSVRSAAMRAGLGGRRPRRCGRRAVVRAPKSARPPCLCRFDPVCEQTGCGGSGSCGELGAGFRTLFFRRTRMFHILTVLVVLVGRERRMGRIVSARREPQPAPRPPGPLGPPGPPARRDDMGVAPMSLTVGRHGRHGWHGRRLAGTAGSSWAGSSSWSVCLDERHDNRRCRHSGDVDEPGILEFCLQCLE